MPQNAYAKTQWPREGRRDGDMTSKLAERQPSTENSNAVADGPGLVARAERFVPASLKVMPERVAATGRTPFVLLVVGILGAGLVALLLLNVALAQDSYRLHKLQENTALLDEQQNTLERQVSYERAPSVLSEKARQQGMVPAGEPAYLDAKTGEVRGKAQPARKSSSADGGE